MSGKGPSEGWSEVMSPTEGGPLVHSRKFTKTRLQMVQSDSGALFVIFFFLFFFFFGIRSISGFSGAVGSYGS